MTPQAVVSDIISRKANQGGIQEIFFVSCGGSLTAFYASKFFLESEASGIRVGYYTSNEFVHVVPASLGIHSVVLLASHRGNTPETLEAVKVSKARSALTIVLTYIEDSPITKIGDYVVRYEWGNGARAGNQKPAMGLRIAVELLEQIEGFKYYKEMQEGFDRISAIVEKGRASIAEKASQFAKIFKDEKIIYTMGSGCAFGSAHQESICVLLEMQWIHSASIHSGEFFHGPFEITDEDTPFILLMSKGRVRPLDERALKFLQKFTKKIMVIDANNLFIDEIDSSVAEYFNGLVLTNALGVFNEKLAQERKHPLTDRRYMWKIGY
jgi:fructoselysine-6-P-deglycase FrlB-like protein